MGIFLKKKAEKKIKKKNFVFAFCQKCNLIRKERINRKIDVTFHSSNLQSFDSYCYSLDSDYVSQVSFCQSFSHRKKLSSFYFSFFIYLPSGKFSRFVTFFSVFQSDHIPTKGQTRAKITNPIIKEKIKQGFTLTVQIDEYRSP